MTTETDYTRKCQQLEVLIDLLERENKRLRENALTPDDIETIRIHLGAFKESLCNQRRWKEAEEYEQLIKKLSTLGGNGHMTEQEAKAILTTYGAPVNIAQHIEAINTAIRALGGKATMAEIWEWAKQPAESAE